MGEALCSCLSNLIFSIVIEHVYDELDRVSEVWYTENNTRTKAYSYEYDANGNLYRFNDHAAKRVHVYKYDLNGNMLMAVEYAENDFYNKFSTDIFYDLSSRLPTQTLIK